MHKGVDLARKYGDTLRQDVPTIPAISFDRLRTSGDYGHVPIFPSQQSFHQMAADESIGAGD